MKELVDSEVPCHYFCVFNVLLVHPFIFSYSIFVIWTLLVFFSIGGGGDGGCGRGKRILLRGVGDSTRSVICAYLWFRRLRKGLGNGLLSVFWFLSSQCAILCIHCPQKVSGHLLQWEKHGKHRIRNGISRQLNIVECLTFAWLCATISF